VQKRERRSYPEDEKQQAIVEQWVDFSTIHIGGAMNKVIFNRLFAKFAKVDVDESSLADGIKFLARFLPNVDYQLSKNAYLAGEELSLADITLLSFLDPAEVGEIDLSIYPHITKWRDVLKTQDFYTQCHRNYAEALKRVVG